MQSDVSEVEAASESFSVPIPVQPMVRSSLHVAKQGSGDRLEAEWGLAQQS